MITAQTQAIEAHTMATIQAQVKTINGHLKDVKQELYCIMSELEKTNLEAHVDLCAERYKGLHDRLSAIEISLKKLSDDVLDSQKSTSKTMIMTAGTVIAGLLSTVVVVLMKF